MNVLSTARPLFSSRPLVLLGVPALLLLAGSAFYTLRKPPAAPRAQAVGQPSGPYHSYQLRVAAGAAAPESRWQVFQGPSATFIVPAEATPAPEHAWAVSGDAVGDEPRAVERDLQALVPLWPEVVSFAPGVRAQTAFGEMMQYDSLHYRLARGEEDREIDGRTARHYRLSATVFATSLGNAVDGVASKPQRITQEIASDFWFAPELPFSWAPFAVWGSAANLNDPVAGGYIRQRLEDRFKQLGLLVRAESDFTLEVRSPGGEPLAPGVREASVTWIEALEETPPSLEAPEFLEEFERISVDEYYRRLQNLPEPAGS